jgi:acetyl esterase/lipase
LNFAFSILFRTIHVSSTKPPFRYSYGDDAEQIADLYLPESGGRHPVLIVVHGGGFLANRSLDGIGPMCAALAEHGLAVWNVEYRRVGNDGGGWPGTWHDLASAADMLRDLEHEHDLDLSRVGTLGHSAGTSLAFWLAARHKVRPSSGIYRDNPLPVVGAISCAGGLDQRAAYAYSHEGGIWKILFGGSPEDVPERYAATSPRDMLPLGIPQLLIHGAADQVIHISWSQSYFNLARAAGDRVRLVVIDNADHLGVRDPRSEFWPPARDAILDFCSTVAWPAASGR